MRLGNCPKCKSNLEEYDHYFCSKCGTQLPIELIYSEVPFNRQTVTVEDALNAKKRTLVSPAISTKFKSLILHVSDPKNRKTYLVAVLVIISGVFCTQVYSKFIARSVVKRPLNIENEVVSPIPAFDLKLALNKASFTEDSVANYIPANVELYARINDLSGLAKLIPGTDFSKAGFLDNSYNSAEVFRILTDNGEQWGVVVKIKSKEIAQNFIENTKSTFWKMKVLNDDVLALTSDEAVFSQMQDANNRTVLNLHLNPKFVVALSKIDKDGKILIVILSDKGKPELEAVKKYVTFPIVSDVVDAFIKSGYNEIVLN